VRFKPLSKTPSTVVVLTEGAISIDNVERRVGSPTTPPEGWFAVPYKFGGVMKGLDGKNDGNPSTTPPLKVKIPLTSIFWVEPALPKDLGALEIVGVVSKSTIVENAISEKATTPNRVLAKRHFFKDLR